MNADIALYLAVDGISTGAIYALIAIGTVLIFTVTRVMFIPFGDIAAFTALTLAAIEAGLTHADCALGGTGGHPAGIAYGEGFTGNTCTEDLATVLAAMGCAAVLLAAMQFVKRKAI